MQHQLSQIRQGLDDAGTWAEPEAINYLNNFAKQQGGKKIVYDKRLFNNADDPGVLGMAGEYSGTPHVRLYPMTGHSAVERNRVLFHEGAHTLDPQLNNLHGASQTQVLLKHTPQTLKSLPSQAFGTISAPGGSTISIPQTRNEAFADALGGNLTAAFYTHGPGRGRVSPPLLQSHLTNEFNRYGGKQTNTVIPKDYRWGQSDPTTSANHLLSRLQLNDAKWQPTMRNFQNGPVVPSQAPHTNPIFSPGTDARLRRMRELEEQAQRIKQMNVR